MVLPSYRGDIRTVFVVGPAGRPDHEPTISVGERPQTYALDCAATGTGYINIQTHEYNKYRVSHYLPNLAFFFNNSKTNENIATKQTNTTDIFLFISHTTNVLLFKFCCNIFIGFRIIKEMPGLVSSGTPCTSFTIHVYVSSVCFG
jgi:hypothetical protein